MRQIGEQWIENGRMYKAVANDQTCRMCCYAGDRLVCTASQEIQNGCDSGWNYCIKDLGPVNEDGMLGCPFCGKYPELQDNRNGSYWYRCQNCGCALSTSDSIKDAKDNSNRRKV